MVSALLGARRGSAGGADLAPGIFGCVAYAYVGAALRGRAQAGALQCLVATMSGPLDHPRGSAQWS